MEVLGVRVAVRCERCDGRGTETAALLYGASVPCRACGGTGRQGELVSMAELKRLLADDRGGEVGQ